MDRRIETRVVDTGGVAATTLVQKNACEVWWITVSDGSADKYGKLKLYDGFDTGGKLKWQWEGIESVTHNFVPPIPCDQGIYIVSDDRVYSYTIAYRPVKWKAPVE